jgi:hypothetical protein
MTNASSGFAAWYCKSEQSMIIISMIIEQMIIE